MATKRKSTTKPKTREEFSPRARLEIARDAMFICSNPACLIFTAYTGDHGRPRAIADAAHIASASADGPERNTPILTKAQLRSAKNGIWLCKNCHQPIDERPADFPWTLLQQWKVDHRKQLQELAGRDLSTMLYRLRMRQRYPQETREFLAFLDSRRVFYEALDAERPLYVWEALDDVRRKMRETRARVSEDAGLTDVLKAFQHDIDTFFRAAGPETDLKTLKVNGSDPCWLRFSEALFALRERLLIRVLPLAAESEYSPDFLVQLQP